MYDAVTGDRRCRLTLAIEWVDITIEDETVVGCRIYDGVAEGHSKRNILLPAEDEQK